MADAGLFLPNWLVAPGETILDAVVALMRECGGELLTVCPHGMWDPELVHIEEVRVDRAMHLTFLVPAYRISKSANTFDPGPEGRSMFRSSNGGCSPPTQRRLQCAGGEA